MNEKDLLLILQDHFTDACPIVAFVYRSKNLFRCFAVVDLFGEVLMMKTSEGKLLL
jgi:hypothetical protein